MSSFSFKSAVTCCLCVFALFAANALAQSGEPGGSPGLTFRGAPKAVTHGFLITEFGVATRLDGFKSRWAVSHGTWDVGYMRNIGAKTAVGGTLFISTDDHFDEAYLIGLKPRFRYWLWRRLHADVSAGLILTDMGGRRIVFNHPDVVGHAGIGYGDWGSIVLQYEGITYNNSTRFFPMPDIEEHNWYLGVNVGSYPGAILGSLAMAAIIFVRSVEWD